jgi:cellulose synthase/poly-beta-1,6-N-acetylglucosamine synthase-like glycosyltransferase
VILLFSILLGAAGAAYLGFLVFCFYHWMRMKEEHTPTSGEASGRFSIIVPARNEGLNIEACLAGLVAQNYPPDKFEIIVVDDYSGDNTGEIVTSFAATHSQFDVRLLRMSDIGNTSFTAYKKKAIAEGISRSKNEWIITTDADCFRGNNWLASIDSFVRKHNPVMICGPVRLENDHSLFQKMQVLEFAGVVSTAAAALEGGLPMTCNGANLTYNKEAFFTVGGFAGIDALNSGDDEMLMMKMHKRWPGKVRFVKHRDAIVYTPAQQDVRAFLQQRKRWVSKSRSHGIWHTLLLAGIYLFHALIVLGIIGAIINPGILIPVGFAVFAKAFLEWPFLYNVCLFFNRYKLAYLYPVALLPQTIYVFFIGIYGNLGTYNWKGRTLR